MKKVTSFGLELRRERRYFHEYKSSHWKSFKLLLINCLCYALESIVVDVLVVIASVSAALQRVLVQLVHAEDLVREEYDSHKDNQQQGHLQLLLVKWFVVHLVLLHPDPLHG